MKRLVLGLAVFAFLGLVAVQSAHAHANPAAENGCCVCAISRQSARLTPAENPTLFAEIRAEQLLEQARPSSSESVRARARARSPPTGP